MRIGAIETRGIKGLADRPFLFRTSRGQAASTVAITGPARSGKSSLLQAIVAHKETVAPYGTPPASAAVLSSDAAAGEAALEWELDEAEARAAGLSPGSVRAEARFRREGLAAARIDPGVRAVLARYGHDGEHGKIDLWSARRQLPPLAVSVGSDVVAEQRPKRLSQNPDKLGGLLRLLKGALVGQGDRHRLETARAIFSALCPPCRIHGLSPLGTIEIATARGAIVDEARLAASEEQALIAASSVAFLRLERSVVLVDTPELGLGPGEAARWLGVLREHCPSAQWILATQDPQVAAACEVVIRMEAP